MQMDPSLNESPTVPMSLEQQAQSWLANCRRLRQEEIAGVQCSSGRMMYFQPLDEDANTSRLAEPLRSEVYRLLELEQSSSASKTPDSSSTARPSS